MEGDAIAMKKGMPLRWGGCCCDEKGDAVAMDMAKFVFASLKTSGSAGFL